MPIKYHYSEFLSFRELSIKNIKSPILLVYAFPYAYGEAVFDTVSCFLDQVKAEHDSIVHKVKFEGTHHFHMMKPAECSIAILNFLDSLKSLKNIAKL